MPSAALTVVVSRGYIEQFSTQRHLVRPVPIREQTIMTYAMEPIGKHVQQETAHELANGELHDLVLVVAILTVVLPAKADVLIAKMEQPAVGDGDAMGVPRKIGQDLLWTCERTLGVDDPFPRAQGSEVSLECLSVSKREEISEELQLASIVSGHETFEEQAPEQAREHPNREEEVRTASHPVHAVGGDTSARYNAVDVRVVIEALSPGMQDSGEADVGAEVLWIGGDSGESLSRGREQQSVDLSLVVIRDGADLCRQSEDDVEVGYGQQLGLARLKPGLRRPPLALRTVPIPARNGELTITCLMGKFRNGELAAVFQSPSLNPALFAPHYDLALSKATLSVASH